MQWFLIGLILVIVAGIFAIAVHLLLAWANRKGWIYYRNDNRPPPRTLGLLEEIYQPAIEHVIDEEVSEQTRADQAESGDPETPGTRD